MRCASSKIVSRAGVPELRERLRSEDRTVVFTNGCFDILHAGHADYLAFSRNQGDVLVVGVNSDASARKHKGTGRPFVGQDERVRLLASLESVDYVVVFDEDEPKALVAELLPDVLVKGKDWAHFVSGREAVEENGGRVVLAEMTQGLSTTELVRRVREGWPTES